MRRGQISSQILIYTLSIIVFAMILLYGYKSIGKFVSDQETVSLVQSQERLKGVVRSALISYGDVEVFNGKNPLSVPGQYSHLCLIDLHYNEPPAAFPGNPDPNSLHPLIYDSWKDRVEKNAFFMENGVSGRLKDSFYLGNIHVSKKTGDAGFQTIPGGDEILNKFICFPISGGLITNMRLEGLGRFVNITTTT